MDWSSMIDHTQGIYKGKIDMASKVNDDRLNVNQDRPFVNYLDDRPVVENRGPGGEGW